MESYTVNSYGSTNSHSHTASPVVVPDEEKNKQQIAGFKEVYALGLAISIGSQIYSWNEGFHSGFWPFFGAVVFMASGYWCLVLCLAEMTSILPFAGGAYGYARVTLGPFAGYFVGSCESMQIVLFVVLSVLKLSSSITELTGFSYQYEPCYWSIFFVATISSQIFGRKIFWRFILLIATVVMAILVTYCCALAPYANFEKNATVVNHAADAEDFFQHFPLAALFFVGIEFMPLACTSTQEAKQTVPIAMMACMGTLTFFALVLVVLTASSPTGIVAIGDADLPLTPGFATAFKMTERFATILSLPMLFATGYGFMFAAGQQVSAMASSGLYIKLLSQSFGYRKVPCFALIFAAFSATVIMVICLLAIRTNLVLVYNVCALGSFIVYISMFVSYLVFSKRYEALQRNFINPFGKGSAIYGCVVFVIGIISVLGFQNDFGAAFIAFFVYVFVMIVYYYLVSKGRQCYSKEEQSILLAAYIINTNSRSRRRSLQRSSKRNSRRSRAATPVSNRSSNLGSMGSHEFSTSTTTTPTFGETRIKKDRSRVWGSFLRTSFRLSIGSYDASEKGPQSTRSGVSMTKIDEEDGIPDIAEKASHSGDAPNVTQILEDDDDDNGEFDADIDECNASVAQSIVKSIAASLTTFDRRRAVHGAGSIDFTSIDQADDVDRSANNGVAMLGEHADDILRLISASQDAYAQPSPSPVDKIRRGLKPIDTSQFQKIDEDSPQDDSNNDFEPSYSRLANNSAFTRNLPTDTKANLMYDSSNSDSFLDSGSFRQDPRNLSTGAISLPVRKNRRTSNSIKALDDTISLSSRKKPRFSSSKSSLYGIRYNLSNISGDFSSRIGKIFPTITIDDEEFIKYAERVVESAQNDVVDLATNIAGSTKGNVRRHSMDEWNYEDVSSTEVLKSIEEAFGTRNSDNYDTTYDLSQDDSIHVHRDN